MNFTVYNSEGEALGKFAHAEDAAAFAATLGDGARIGYGRTVIVWREGAEDTRAAESFDVAARVMLSRIDAAHK